MEEISIKVFNKEEYIELRDVYVDNKKYYIYVDTKTQTKAIICNEKKEKTEDKMIIKSIATKLFTRDTGIIYQTDDDSNDGDDNNYEDENTEIYTPEEFEESISYVKEIFFKKFGDKLLTDEELEKRIRNNVKEIYKDPTMLKKCYDGQYMRDSKTIVLRSKLRKSTLFHEFIHAIIRGGLDKKIIIDDTSYVYGRQIDEGIVSYIQYMENVEKWQKHRDRGSYNSNRRLIGQIKTIYNNLEKDVDDDFIEEYIKDPKGTLPRINEIFRQDIKSKNPDLTDRELDLYSMRNSLNFIIDFDEMYRYNNEDETMVYSPEIFKKLENTLTDIFIRQMYNKPIKTIDELCELLYDIEGFSINLSEKNDMNDMLDKLKKDKINDLLRYNTRIKLYSLKKKVRQNTKKMNLYNEYYEYERVLRSIFGESEIIDVRTKGILNTIQELQDERKIEKAEIGKEFGLTVSEKDKTAVENEIKSGQNNSIEKNEGENKGDE